MTIKNSNDLTVVIPAFNRGKELYRALGSLVAQTHPNFEVIVCDDGSTENIASVVQDFYGRLKLRLLRIDNSGGPARPRNVATKAAYTRWISYLDSDDWWDPSRMAMLEPHLNDWRDVVYHPLRVERVDRAFTVKPLHKSQIGEPIRIDDPIIHMIRYGNPLATSGTTVKRELIIATGGFNENIELASVEDFDLWLRLATAGARFYFLPQILGTYWVGENHISNFSERQFERQRHLFLHQLELLPDRYRSKAQSNFSYLLGSYALSLNLPNAQTYFNELKFMVEPIRWIKSRVKLWDAELKKVFKN